MLHIFVDEVLKLYQPNCLGVWGTTVKAVNYEKKRVVGITDNHVAQRLPTVAN
jgi:hypothetical protein